MTSLAVRAEAAVRIADLIRLSRLMQLQAPLNSPAHTSLIRAVDAMATELESACIEAIMPAKQGGGARTGAGHGSDVEKACKQEPVSEAAAETPVPKLPVSRSLLVRVLKEQATCLEHLTQRLDRQDADLQAETLASIAVAASDLVKFTEVLRGRTAAYGLPSKADR